MVPSSASGPHIFHVIAFVLANAAFAWAVASRFRLMGKAQPVAQWAPLEARLRSVLLNVLFQKKLFNQPVRGLMHAFVFYGFIAYALHTTSQMIAGNAWSFLVGAGSDPHEFMIPAFTGILHLGEAQALAILAALVTAIAVTAMLHSKLGTSVRTQWMILGALLAEFAAAFAFLLIAGRAAYEAIVQNFSLLVLIGLSVFAFRRWVRRAPELDVPSPQSAIVLSLIGTLMLSTIVGAAAQARLSGEAHSWVTVVIGRFFDVAGIASTRVEALALRDFSWWVHILTVYAFMIYIPNSKHSHLIFAPVNYFLIQDRPRGAMKPMDLENATVYGAASIPEFSWTSLLGGMSCIECGRCTLQCPANRTGKPLNPKKIMVDLKHAMLDHASEIRSFNPDEGYPARVIGDPYITAEEIWSCTSCMACVEACPVGNNQLEAIFDMRRNQVLVDSDFPPQLQLAFNNMEKNSNPWGVGAHTRADWAQGLGVKTMAEDSSVDILYWVGCAASFDERNKAVARSFVKILQAADVKFAILGTEENCTGDSARRGGNEYLYQTLATTNVETLNRYNVKKIVTACPHCFNTLKNEYPQFGGMYEVHHHSEFIDMLLQQGRIQLDDSSVAAAIQGTSTYHDSCYLGRYNDVYQAPRRAVQKATGHAPAEAVDHGTKSLCCGAGGAQMWMEEQYERVNIKRTKQLLATGASTIAVACPFCNVMITDGVKAEGEQEKVHVLDLAQIVASGLKDG